MTTETAKLTGDWIDPSAGRVTVGDVYDQWRASSGHLKASTAATREVTWRVHTGPKWSGVTVGKVQTSTVRAWVAQMVTDGAGTATIENALGLLRMVLETAAEDRRIPRNPCAGVKVPRREHRQRGYLTHIQVQELADETGEPDVVQFLAYTGLRWSEMAALRVSDFEMLRRRVHVTRAVVEVKGALVWGSPKTHERRSVPFPKFLVPLLAARMVGKGRNELVFTSTEGAVLRVSTWRPRVFKPAVVRLQERATEQRNQEELEFDHATTPEFPTVTPHDMRHTAASLAISAGANVKSVQTMLGHASAAMTLDTYSDLFPDDLEAVSDALDLARTRAQCAQNVPTDAKEALSE
ncbi:site-specific integrase [Rhodococcus sp. UFZ-B548]|uniref:tyrosine-type recombinase/integrase n=1 Tax=Rhodococcus sp. UFZ-B548 TaxID=2742212 RepID=UPI002174D4EA|nr:site-specific integrase [Rhodococcus sp. UFZ-B548]